ncbi:MAG: hypothetical protein JWO05_1175 [Gemmatimonadetes bacterium]|nr:hypothetical protein [Gemmatimonadota bacterium]
MRRIALIPLALAVFAAGCASDKTVAPATTALDELALYGDAALGTGPATLGPGLDEVPLADRLPSTLALTDAQKASIKGFEDAFRTATAADREALDAIVKQAREAQKAGKSRSDIQAILQTGADYRDHIQAAEVTLKGQITGVLTADQKAWIASHAPGRCDRSSVIPLTDAQKQQIRALTDAFDAANKADLASVKATFEQARAAKKAGKSDAEVKAILDGAKDAVARLEANRKTLRTQLDAVLTDAQKASGCPPFGPGGPGGQNGPMGPGGPGRP